MPRIFFQSKALLVSLAVGWGAVLFLLVAGIASPTTAVPKKIILGAVSALLIAIIVVSLRSGIRVAADEVVVRGYFGRTRRVPWRQVRGFAARPNGNGGRYVTVETSDGRFLKTQGLATSNLRRAEAVIAELEAARAAYSQPDPPSGA